MDIDLELGKGLGLFLIKRNKKPTDTQSKGNNKTNKKR